MRNTFIEFLDTRIYKAILPNGEWELRTRVYFKPTDTHQLLHKESFHPRHTCRGVLKSQFIRFKRIASTVQDYNDACTILWHALKMRGYSKQLYLSMKRDIWLYYNKPLREQETAPREIIPIINFFDPIGSKITQETRAVISENPMLANHKVVSAFKIHKNLRKYLVVNNKV